MESLRSKVCKIFKMKDKLPKSTCSLLSYWYKKYNCDVVEEYYSEEKLTKAISKLKRKGIEYSVEKQITYIYNQ